MSLSSSLHVPSAHASAKHNRSGKTRPRRRADGYGTTSDEDSDDLDRALAQIQAYNARFRAAAQAAPGPAVAGIPFPTAAAAVDRHHRHHARAPRDLPAQKPMPSPGAPLPLPPTTPPRPVRGRSAAPGRMSDRNKPLPRSPSPRARKHSFNSTASYVGSEETGAPAPSPGELGRLRWAQYNAMIADARASTDSLRLLMRGSPTLMYKGSSNSSFSHSSSSFSTSSNPLPPIAEPQKKTRTFGEFLKTAKKAGARVRKTSLDAYYATTDKAWELRVAAKYAGKDVQKAAGTLKRTVSRELLRGSGGLRRVVSLSSRV